jgi:hypothetical protein
MRMRLKKDGSLLGDRQARQQANGSFQKRIMAGLRCGEEDLQYLDWSTRDAF